MEPISSLSLTLEIPLNANPTKKEVELILQSRCLFEEDSDTLLTISHSLAEFNIKNVGKIDLITNLLINISSRNTLVIVNKL